MKAFMLVPGTSFVRCVVDGAKHFADLPGAQRDHF